MAHHIHVCTNRILRTRYHGCDDDCYSNAINEGIEMTEFIRTEDEIKEQIYACEEWKNLQYNAHLIAQADTEIRVLEWVLKTRNTI